MISRLSESWRGTDFGAIDIETTKRGRVFLIGAAVSYEPADYVECPDWSSVLEEIERRARVDSRWRTLYAHNGGGFDYVSLVAFLRDERRPFRCGTSGSSIVLLDLPSTRGGPTLHFRDSMKLVPVGLDKASKAFGGPGKSEMDGLPWEVWKRGAEGRAKVREYLRRDVHEVLRIVGEFSEIVRTRLSPDCGRLGATLASTALRIWRTTLKHDIRTPWNRRVRSLLREGFRGGRVECLRPGRFSGVHVFDANSLYPSVMKRTDVPSTDRGTWTKQAKDLDRCGVYRVQFRQPFGVPLLMVQGRGRRVGEGVYFANELRRLREIGGSFEVFEGFVFDEQSRLFSTLVNRCWKMRVQNKGTALDFTAKIVANSTYGKTAERDTREEIILSGDPEKGWTEIDAVAGIWSVETVRQADHEHVGIAGTITSEARVRLHEALSSVPEPLYCDTDSVHTVQKLPAKLIGSDLGEWKPEESNVEAVYVGKKLYGMKRQDGTERLRIKGVRVGGPSGASITFDDFARLESGGSIIAAYQSPPTVREVLSGARPAEFIDRTRTIRRTV
jgi:hypothetical protein